MLNLNRPARRRHLRAGWALFVLGMLAIGAGYLLLAVPMDAPADLARQHAFAGMGLVVTGAVVALSSRLL